MPMMKSWNQIETINNYTDYEFLELDTVIRLYYDEEVYYHQNKWDIINESKLKNVTFNDDLNQITLHTLTPLEGDPQNIHDNMRISFQYREEYLFWVYFDNERIRVFNRIGL